MPFCIVVGCGSTSLRDKDVHFYRIPSINTHRGQESDFLQNRRQQWVNSFKRQDLTESKLKYGRVCSKHFLTDTNPPRVLLIYKASLNSHCNVVHNLALLLNDVLQMKVLLDVFEVPETHHQDPILWCNQAINFATHIVYIASPEVPPNKVVATNNIYRIDGVAMKFIMEKLARNDSSKQILVVTFPYSIDAVPPELSNVQRFHLMKDMNSFVNSLVMLPYHLWIVLHIFRLNKFWGEPQYMELIDSIKDAQDEVEILTNCPTSPSSQALKITITQNRTENIAAPEGATEDEEALLETSDNFSFRLSDVDISGNASAPQRPAIEANTNFSINIQDVAQ